MWKGGNGSVQVGSPWAKEVPAARNAKRVSRKIRKTFENTTRMKNLPCAPLSAMATVASISEIGSCGSGLATCGRSNSSLFIRHVRIRNEEEAVLFLEMKSL